MSDRPHRPGRPEAAGGWLHPLLLPAALGLAACAGLAGRGAVELQHTGAWPLITVAAVLAVAALGLATRQLWAFAFALLFWATTAVGGAGLRLPGLAGAHERGGRRLVRPRLAAACRQRARRFSRPRHCRSR